MKAAKIKITKNTARTAKKKAYAVAKAAVKKVPAAAVKRISIPPGMSKTPSGIFVPSKLIQPVPAGKLKKGFEKAKVEIKGMIDEVASILTGEYNIKEIELEVSFSADGKFMGFGVGGSSTIKIKIAPV
jgi:hypothetical protein